MTDHIAPDAFHTLEGLGDWRVISDGACAFFRTTTFADSARFVAAVAALDGIADHPPAVDVRHDGVTVRFITVAADFMGMTPRDAELARRVSSAARDQAIRADPAAIQSLLLIPGAPAGTAIMPFWRAVLGYEPRADSPEEDLVDPHDRLTPFWFEQMDEPRGDGGGAIHVAVWLPFEQAEARVRAGLAAGGHIVRDDRAPSWWTLADAAGNEVDISTVQQRDAGY